MAKRCAKYDKLYILKSPYDGEFKYAKFSKAKLLLKEN